MHSPYGIPKFERVVDSRSSKMPDNGIEMLIESISKRETAQVEEINSRATQQAHNSTSPSTTYDLPLSIPTNDAPVMTTPLDMNNPAITNVVKISVDATGVRVKSCIEAL